MFPLREICILILFNFEAKEFRKCTKILCVKWGFEELLQEMNTEQCCDQR